MAAALSFASGVMIWLAFMGVLGGEAKAYFIAHYNDHGHSHGDDYENEVPVDIRIWSGVFFLAGLGVTVFLEILVDKYFGEIPGHSHGGGGHGHSHGQGHEHGQELAAHPHEDHHDAESHAHHDAESDDKNDAQVFKLSMIALAGFTLHSFPEGLATFLAASKGDFMVAIGIGLHHLPGGAAIALPMYKSTKSFMKAFQATAIAAVALPAGALFGWGLIEIFGLVVENFTNGAIYSATAGILCAVALAGMLPEAFATSTNFFVLAWVAAGFFFTEGSIILTELSGGHSHGEEGSHGGHR